MSRADLKNKSTSVRSGIVSVFIVALVTFVFGEILFRVYDYLKYGKTSVAALLDSEQTNMFIKTLTKGKVGSFLDLHYPHPYLGFIYKKYPGYDINNVGLFGRDFPFKKDPGKFTVLVTGGSVASLFAAEQRGVVLLEKVLNERYDFGGKTVVVLNGAAGSWKQPQQAIMSLLYADVVDGIISIDGYNENHKFKDDVWSRLEMPTDGFVQSNPLVENSFKKLFGAWITSSLYQYSQGSFAILNSHFAYYVTKAFRSAVQAVAEDSASRDWRKETNLNSLYLLPEDWSKEEKIQYNVEQYKKYIKVMDAVADKLKIQRAFFVQPVPAIGKKLTSNEKSKVGDLGYGGVYKYMAGSVLGLSSEGVPVYSLLDIYSDFEGDIYSDDIHSYSADGYENPGYKIMTEKVASVLAQSWGLKLKSN